MTRLERDIEFLNNRFSQATSYMGYKNTAGTDLYQYQVDYAYKINNLTYVPESIRYKVINNIKTFIENIPSQ